MCSRSFARLVRGLALTSLLLVSTPGWTLAQTNPLGPGSVLRFRPMNPAPGRSLIGTLREVRDDSLFIQLKGDAFSTAYPASILGDPDYKVQSKTGTKAVPVAVGGFVVGAGLGFVVGYCFQIFGDGCAHNLDGGVKAGAALGGISALLGAFMGSLVPKFEDIDGDPFGGARPRLATYIDPMGRFGVSLRFGAPGGSR